MSNRTSYTTSMNLRDKPTFENFLAICEMLGYTSVANEVETGSPTAFGRAMAMQYPYVVAGVLSPVMNMDPAITRNLWASLIEAADKLGYTGGTENEDARPFAQMTAMLMDLSRATPEQWMAWHSQIQEKTNENHSDIR